MPDRRPVPIGLAEIAEVFGVNEATPTRWKYLRARTKFPPPDGHVSRTVPWWWSSTIEEWGRATGRWPGDDVGAARVAAVVARAEARAAAEDCRIRVEWAQQRLAAYQQDLERAEAAFRDADAHLTDVAV